MKYIVAFLLLPLSLQFSSFSQEVAGNFSALTNQPIKLYGFNNFETYLIDSIKTDETGNFSLQFSAEDHGMGFLNSVSGENHFVILTGEQVVIKGQSIAQSDETRIEKGVQNKAFLRYVTEQPKREQVFSAWDFLRKNYSKDPLFADKEKPRAAITNEIERLSKEEKVFLAELPKDSYVAWFLPMRKLVSNISVIAQYRPEEIPSTLQALRAINYADDRLYKSGLLKSLLENHIWFVENTSGPLDQVFNDLNESIDIIISQLKQEDDKFNLVSSKLFEVLEERSLFTSSEYLSKKLLDEADCGCLNPDLEKRLHKYGKMATGSIAPDITFTDFTYYPEGVSAKKMSELSADYYLVIFAAGWCPHCTEEIPEIAEFYPELKEKNVEVILVSLDETAQEFAKFAAPMPFVSTTDYQKWDGKAATDYQVYGTPSYFLLDKDLEIKIKLKSPDHLKAWVNQMIPNK